jgi:hypothetical protein
VWGSSRVAPPSEAISGASDQAEWLSPRPGSDTCMAASTVATIFLFRINDSST